ncbi:MAG: hypothetical protein K2M42_08560 [Oscillospiraceae bacterium]|nr:hypothetical protein [Oscillospiraceae bacterium]
MNNDILKFQFAAGLLLQETCADLHISREDFSYVLAESLNKPDKCLTVLGYFQKVPKKFLVPRNGYQKFRTGLLESVDKLCTGKFLCNVDGKAVRDCWDRHGEELMTQLDEIHRKANEAHLQTVAREIQKKIENLLSN